MRERTGVLILENKSEKVYEDIDVTVDETAGDAGFRKAAKIALTTAKGFPKGSKKLAVFMYEDIKVKISRTSSLKHIERDWIIAKYLYKSSTKTPDFFIGPISKKMSFDQIKEVVVKMSGLSKIYHAQNFLDMLMPLN